MKKLSKTKRRRKNQKVSRKKTHKKSNIQPVVPEYDYMSFHGAASMSLISGMAVLSAMTSRKALQDG